MNSEIPSIRITVPVDSAPAPRKKYVLYWMTAQRRMQWNYALQHSISWCQKLKKPLLIFEPLRVDYRWNSQRFHQWVLEGMKDNAERLSKTDIAYLPYVEPEIGHGKGLLASLASEACVVVTDEFPCYFLPRMLQAATRQLSTRFEVVDGNGLLPLRATLQEFPTAYAFRRFLQKNLPSHLNQAPLKNPLRNYKLERLTRLPTAVAKRWPSLPSNLGPAPAPTMIADLPIDQDVKAVERSGGSRAAEERWSSFLENSLGDYDISRNQPESNGSSGLSPYLHFGHISVHQLFDDLTQKQSWTADKLSSNTSGKRSGWWGMSAPAEAFLDELITWRELGYVFCFHRSNDYDRYDSLPEWARTTLNLHRKDPRPHRYAPKQLEQALTHDELWNAAQRQLVQEGVIHNYLRMLWGKKILEWSPNPQRALQNLIHLNNKYSVDGRNPNSYSGIFWTLGRFDRAWGPERPIFGKIRYMSSVNTARKVNVKNYIQKYSPQLF